MLLIHIKKFELAFRNKGRTDKNKTESIRKETTKIEKQKDSRQKGLFSYATSTKEAKILTYTVKKYLWSEAAYLVAAIPYLVWLYLSNRSLNEKYKNESLIQKAINVVEQNNDLAISLLKWGAFFILIGIVLITIHVYINKNDYSDEPLNTLWFYLCLGSNIIIILLILIWLANPILIGFAIITFGVSGIVMSVS